MHACFGLTLVVNHACNLRCTYCYTGAKIGRVMPLATGQRAIDRAIRSLHPGGTLELGFFGGEPLLEAELILELIAYARGQTQQRQLDIALSMTTNGTLETPAALQVMSIPDLELAISHDGVPAVHDRHRVTSDGHPTSKQVESAIGRLVREGREFRVVQVVRPDNLETLAAGLEYLYGLGARQFVPSLDLWTTWTRDDGARLRNTIRHAAEFWAARLPECSVSWFDEKAAHVLGVPLGETARCGFGCGEIAVTPAGNLYPCERLVGADEPNRPLRLPGNAHDGNDFLAYHAAAKKSAVECRSCALQSSCSTTCRCSNFIRSGDVARPDGLLCAWDQTCMQETIRVLESRNLVPTGGAL